MREDFVVYFHERLDTNAVFYVGKGTHKRVRQKCNRNPHWHNIVSKAGGFNHHLVATGLVEIEALELERLLIAEMRNLGFQICNMTDGGDGVSGFKHSEETKRAMSVKRTGMCSAIKGRKFSPEHIENLKRAKLGKKQTPEHIKNAADTRRGKAVSEQTRQKISSALSGRTTAKEVVARKYKAVLCTTTSVVYESVTAAAKALKLQTSNISRCCKGIFNQTGGYSFEYTQLQALTS